MFQMVQVPLGEADLLQPVVAMWKCRPNFASSSVFLREA